jgi:hypothetical protein
VAEGVSPGGSNGVSWVRGGVSEMDRGEGLPKGDEGIRYQLDQYFKFLE